MKDSSTRCAQFCNAIPQQGFFNGCKKGPPQKSETNAARIVRKYMGCFRQLQCIGQTSPKSDPQAEKTTVCVFGESFIFVHILANICLYFGEYLSFFRAETRHWLDANPVTNFSCVGNTSVSYSITCIWQWHGNKCSKICTSIQSF